MRTLPSTFIELNRLEVKVVVVPRQESRVSLGALVPRDRQGSQDRPGRKDPWDRVESEAMMANQEAKVLQVPREPQGR